MTQAAYRSFRALAALALAAAAVSACGKMGQLDRPGPLFHRGEATGATSKQADDQARKSQDPSHPVNTVDPRDINTEPAPPRVLPIPGAPGDPGRGHPPGALPDPYSNPPR